MDTNKLAIPIAIILAGGLIAGSLYLSNKNNIQKLATTNNPATSSININMRPVTADDHILGDPNADLVIVEYSDTECPFCKEFHATMQQIMAEYGKDSKVAWVYRHFPIDANHKKSRKEAEALECANELGGPTAFWKYTDTLYNETNSNDTFDPAGLPIIAKDIGIDVSAFTACLSSGKYAAKVQADYEDAISAGAQGTPTSVIITKSGDKIPVDGAQSYDDLKSTIDLLLKS